MPYSQFKLDNIKQELGLELCDRISLFKNVPPVEYSAFLSALLAKYSPLAIVIGTEKSKSEFIIAPILFELKEQLENKVSLFSGKEFNVDPEKGLSGFRDFLISKSPEQLIIESSVIIVVEAKNDNILSGIGQCIAEMVTAQVFNERHQNPILIIYGVITTGSNWKFLRLQGDIVTAPANLQKSCC